MTTLSTASARCRLLPVSGRTALVSSQVLSPSPSPSHRKSAVPLRLQFPCPSGRGKSKVASQFRTIQASSSREDYMAEGGVSVHSPGGRKTEVAIIGSGSVGAQIAWDLMQHGNCSEVLLIDKDEQRCFGEVMDLADGGFLTDTSVRQGTWQEVAAADIIVITAGAKQQPGETRDALFDRNCSILSSIARNLGTLGPETIVLLVANPVDALTLYFQRVTGLPPQRVIGSGTYLDSMRLRREIASRVKVAASAVHAMVVGQHGDLQVPLMSVAHIGNQPLASFPELNGDNGRTLVQLARDTKDRAYAIIERKGSTSYGISACVMRLCTSILANKKQIFPVSVYSPEMDTYVSLPAVVGKGGIQRVLPLTNLSAEELEGLKRAAEGIRSSVARKLEELKN
eukprot:jgi/Mesvir1/1035/Mv17561-RA.1